MEVASSLGPLCSPPGQGAVSGYLLLLLGVGVHAPHVVSTDTYGKRRSLLLPDEVNALTPVQPSLTPSWKGGGGKSLYSQANKKA